MSRKQLEVAIAPSVIVQALAALPSGCWFLLSNVRLQGRATDKPSDSRMNADKQKAGFRYIGKDLDEAGVPVDILATVESPNQFHRVDEDGKRVQGVNYPSVVFRGSLAKEAVKRALAWDTVSAFGSIATTKDEDGRMTYRFTGMFITDGNETVSVQLSTEESKTFFVEAKPNKGTQASA